jgi:PAS domain S-box-containing protein
MLRRFRNLPIKYKVAVVIVLASMMTLLLTSTSLFVFQWWNTRQVIQRDLLAQGQIIAANSTAALKFQDQQAAEEILAALRAKPHILQASLHQPEGETLAAYGGNDATVASLPQPAREGLAFHESRVELFQPVILNGQRVGTLHLCFNSRAMEREIIMPFLFIMGGTLLAALLSAIGLSAALHPLISRPILRLAETAHLIAAHRDYSVRAAPSDRDELGTLTGAFNQMLEEIQTQDTALKRSQQKIEALVHSIDGIVWECTPDTFQFTFVSRQSERLLGYAPGQWLASPTFWQDHVHPQDAQRAIAICHEAVGRRQHYQYEYRMIAADGRVVWIRECGVVLVEHDRPLAVRGIFLDVTAQKQAADELDRLNHRLVETSRHAGMAEVATGVLHNVGNVLNSVNVSASLIIDRVQHSRLANLGKLAGMLRAHAGDLGRYLTEDPKGRHVPDYLSVLATHLSDEQRFVLQELEGLRKHIDHIKDIVAMQQNYAKVAGVVETVPPAQLVEDALQLNAGALERHQVKVCREFETVPPVAVEKHKVLQILVNLIRNAKYAMDEARFQDKCLRLRLTAPDPNRVRIEVIDNGMGIPPENLTRIFQHGFTTRKDGHGFGLHNGALTARELGGTLRAHSDGLGTGSTFTLELPVQRSVTVAPDAASAASSELVLRTAA